jgi:hypothetical protein
MSLVLGYHSFSSMVRFNESPYDDVSFERRKELFGTSKLFNSLNLLGYVPGLGIWSGYAHIKMLNKDDATVADKICLCVRAIFEILGVGLLLLPVDFAASFYRHIITGGPTYPDHETNTTYLEIFTTIIIKTF